MLILGKENVMAVFCNAAVTPLPAKPNKTWIFHNCYMKKRNHKKIKAFFGKVYRLSFLS